MEKEYLKNNYIAPIIVVIIGILFLVFVINPYIDHQKQKQKLIIILIKQIIL